MSVSIIGNCGICKLETNNQVCNYEDDWDYYICLKCEAHCTVINEYQLLWVNYDIAINTIRSIQEYQENQNGDPWWGVLYNYDIFEVKCE